MTREEQLLIVSEDVFSNYIEAHHNQIVNIFHTGMSISAGNYNNFHDNRLVSSGKIMHNGTERFIKKHFSSGAFINDYGADSTEYISFFSNNAMENNNIAWMHTSYITNQNVLQDTVYQRFDWYITNPGCNPDSGTVYYNNNPSIIARDNLLDCACEGNEPLYPLNHEVTLADEAYEYTYWRQKLRDSLIAIGPSLEIYTLANQTFQDNITAAIEVLPVTTLLPGTTLTGFNPTGEAAWLEEYKSQIMDCSNNGQGNSRTEIVTTDNPLHPFGEKLRIMPNPSHGHTTIAYRVLQQGKVSIDMIGLLGNKVAAIVNNENHTKGDFEVHINAANFKRGIYLCRLKTGNSMEVKRFLVVE